MKLLETCSMSLQIPVFFHPEQLEFKPKYEWALGHRIKHPETTKRAESIYNALKKKPQDFQLNQPKSVPMKAIRESHSYELITLYHTAATLKDGETFYPSVFPQRSKASAGPTNLKHAGFYCFDSGTPLDNKTWSAASWSAACAWEAMKLVRSQKYPFAYALSRPPGHHASSDTYGGYCYFNNSAMVARELSKKGRVVVLDIDFHHGNGTQELFYEDDQVTTISIHGDPRDYFPYFRGFASETGEGKGRGHNLNIILPAQTTYKKYKKTLRDIVFPMIEGVAPSYLIIAAGFDTYKLDPIGDFALETKDYFFLGQELGSLKLPSLVVQEGGYFTRDLGKNVVSFLQGLKDA